MKAILPPNPPTPAPGRDVHGLQTFYNPPCPQYRGMLPGGIVHTGNGYSVGTCSPNRANNPFLAPYDFSCRRTGWGQQCVGSNGIVANSPNGVCCPPPIYYPQPPIYYPQPPPYFPPRPFPFPPLPNPPRDDCCSRRDVNTCARCLDRKQGTTSSAAHFANMTKCQRMCGFNGDQHLLYGSK